MGTRGDLVVVGNGPAGLAAAAACAEQGLDVTVLAQDHDAPWPQTFGVWVDELAGLGLDDIVAERWATVAVRLGQTPAHRLERAYGRLDNRHLRAALEARLERAGGRRVTGRAVDAEHGPAGTAVRTASGERLRCRLAIDASGHRPALLAAGRGRPPAAQTAFGIVARCSSPPVAPGTMMLMDYRDPSGGAAAPGPPTFLYAMPMGGGCHLLEETVLASRPAREPGWLQARLRLRLDTLGVRVEERVAVERVHIPMGGPLPSPGQRVVGFGAAAGMVHPATGYQVGAALARAPHLGRALAGALDDPGATPAGVAAAGWRAVWPPDLLRQRALHTLGLESLLRFGPEDTRAFFGAFFDLPPYRWRGFLSGERSVGALAATMLALFAAAPPGVRTTLASTAVQHPEVLRAAIRPTPAHPSSS
ncbi:MAG: lycopene cyclase family protein [Egibacteraceae bacterium]